MHYAESLVPGRRTPISRFLIIENGKRLWVEKPDMASDGGAHFPEVGKRFIESGRVRDGRIGSAHSMLFSTRDLVNFAEVYFREALR